MFLSRRSRRMLAGIAAVMLLACQSMAVAQASTAGASQSGGVAPGSCHDSGQDSRSGGASDNPCGAPCQHAFSAPAKAGTFDSGTADLPVMTVRVDRLATTTDIAPPVESWPARAESPPLSILHCCLRN
jgi:hypothetical protein